jgi:hypothetical protein
MNDKPNGIRARLARGWNAVVKALTPSGPGGVEKDVYGSDTTMFGPGPEPPAPGHQPRRAKNDFWSADESSYLDGDDRSSRNDRR